MDHLAKGCFDDTYESYGEFVRALLAGDAQAMGSYLGDQSRTWLWQKRL